MRNYILIIGFVIIFIGMSFTNSFAIQMDNKSQITITRVFTLYVGGSGTNNYSTIQSAINDASDGDVVFVYDDSSPYYENLIINKSIILNGENRDTTVIDGKGVGIVINVSSEWIYISEFSIQNAGITNSSAGLYINSNYGVISHNNIENNTYGIYMISSEKIYIVRNKITNNKKCGVYLKESPNNYISSNFINNHAENGVVLDNSSDITVFNNTILNHKNSGIVVKCGLSNYINKNMISKNFIGLKIKFSSNNIIINNNFIKNVFREAYHIGNKILHKKNIWMGNYWNRPRLIPKPIFGKTMLFFITIPWINFDWSPAKVQNIV